jgi:N-acetylmuramoyl-L-alanine amidase
VLLADPTCTAAAGSPIPRSGWDARAPAVFPDGSGENGPYSAANPNGWLVYDQALEQVYRVIVVHHSALPLSDGPREIQNLHMDEKGFADIGYHYLIDQSGSLYEGRAIDVRGAHTLGYNYGTVGICLIGNFEEIQPAQAQVEMLQNLVACLLGRFPKIDRLAGHNDYNPGVTLCPGENLAPLLPRIARQFGLQSGA